jgi:UDP-glucose 4-epimerase
MSDGKRILITGVARYLGLRLAMRLAGEDGISQLIGVDLDEPAVSIDGLDFVRADIRKPLIARVVEATKTETVVHTNITSSPRRIGGRLQMRENNVIGTMQLLAAAQRAERVKHVVMRSSTAVYGSGPGEPSILPEGYGGRERDLEGYARDCAEAETYMRDFARRRKDVTTTILRTQSVIGPTVTTGMTQYLSMPVIPTALGYDPRLQLLHEADAVEALRLATLNDVPGIFNVAGNGVVFLSQAIRLLGRAELPLALPLAQSVATLLRALRTVDFPTDQLTLLLFGRVVDTSRARAALGFEPSFSTRQAIEELRDRRGGDYEIDARPNLAWERQLFDYLERRPGAESELV